MFDALKKFIGADEEGKKRRQQAFEDEEREREERVRANAKKMKSDTEQGKKDREAKEAKQ